jgi:hypothetical protein
MPRLSKPTVFLMILIGHKVKAFDQSVIGSIPVCTSSHDRSGEFAERMKCHAVSVHQDALYL